MEAEIELRHKSGEGCGTRGILLRMDIWTLLLFYFMRQEYSPKLDDCNLYINGEEVPKPFWWDIDNG